MTFRITRKANATVTRCASPNHEQRGRWSESYAVLSLGLQPDFGRNVPRMRDQRIRKFSSELPAKHQQHVRFFRKIRSLRRLLRFDSGRVEQRTVPKKLTGRGQTVCPLYQNNSTHVACLIGRQRCLAGLFPRLLDQRCVWYLDCTRMKPRAHADKCVLSWRAQFAWELKRIKIRFRLPCLRTAETCEGLPV